MSPQQCQETPSHPYTKPQEKDAPTPHPKQPVSLSKSSPATGDPTLCPDGLADRQTFTAAAKTGMRWMMIKEGSCSLWPQAGPAQQEQLWLCFEWEQLLPAQITVLSAGLPRLKPQSLRVSQKLDFQRDPQLSREYRVCDAEGAGKISLCLLSCLFWYMMCHFLWDRLEVKCKCKSPHRVGGAVSRPAPT